MPRLKRLYWGYVLARPKLHYRLRPYEVFVQYSLQHIKSFPRQLLTVDLVRFFICLPRYIVYYHVLRRRKFAADIETGVSRNTIKHNMRGTTELAVPRSHELIRPVVSIGRVQRNLGSLKVLTIGPRVEGEIYNLIGYGFRAKNVVGLDLFSYSPHIRVGNMHHMDFTDGEFDITLLSSVLAYSDDKVQCAREVLRVTKPGGIIAVSHTHSLVDRSQIAKQLGYEIGADEPIPDIRWIEKLFGVDVEDCYFRCDGSKDGVQGASIITIFRAPDVPRVRTEARDQLSSEPAVLSTQNEGNAFAAATILEQHDDSILDDARALDDHSINRTMDETRAAPGGA